FIFTLSLHDALPIYVNLTLFGDSLFSCILIVRCKDPDEIAQQLHFLGNLIVQVDCLGGVSVFNMTIRDEKKKKLDSFARSLKNRSEEHTSELQSRSE